MVDLLVKDGSGLPGAARLLGLVGIKEDLNVVNDTCEAALDFLGGDVENVHALDELGRTWLHAFYVTALVTYARCFNGGARTRLEEGHVRVANGENGEAAVRVHRVMMLTRDRHVAHAVSPYESGVLGVIVRPDNTVWGTDAMVFQQNLAPNAFGQLRFLVASLLPAVDELILRSREHVLKKAREVDAQAWEAEVEAEWVPPTLDDLGLSMSVGRPIPQGGAWGYGRTIRVDDDALEAGQVVRSGPDGPMRRRQVWSVEGPDREAVFRDVGEVPDQ